MFSKEVFILQQMRVNGQMFPFILVGLQCQVHGGQGQVEFLGTGETTVVLYIM